MATDNRQTPYTQSGKKLEEQQANSPTALVQSHRSFLEQRLPQINRWVTQGVKPEALVRFCLLDISENQKLRECTPQSIYLGLLACAVTGLEPGALKGEAYLVPFAGKAQFMPGWKGLVKQARRSLEVEGIGANVVRERDTFELDLGTANTLVHRPAKRDRGEVIGAYAIAKMKGGHFEIEWMDRDDLDAIQKVAESRGKSPAWSSWEDQMQRKSPIRRLCKRLPLGADYFVGLALEQADDQASVLDMETSGEASRVVAGPHVAAEIRSAKNANEPADVVSSTANATAPVEKAPEPAKEKTAKPKEAKAKAEEKPAEPAPSSAPADPNKEDRPCSMCGVVVECDKTSPAGTQRCYACANS